MPAHSTADGMSKRWYVVLSILCAIPFLWNCIQEKFFSADASFYFVRMLDSGHFMDFAWSRNHAVYLTEWPLIAAVQFGITHLGTLKFLHGFGLIFPMIISLVGSWVYCPAAKRNLLMLPLLSIFVLNYPSDAIMTGESHVLIYLSWPLFFAVISERLFERSRFIPAVILAILYARLYESALFTGGLLTGILFLRLLGEKESKNRTLGYALMLILAASAIIAAWAIVFPRDPNNRSDFIGAMLSGILQPVFQVSFAFTLFWCLAALFQKSMLRVVGYVVGALVLLYQCMIGMPDLTASVGFGARTLSFTILPLLIGLAWLMQRMHSADHPPLRGLVMGLMVLVCFQVYSTTAWMDYRDEFKTTLSSNHGYVPVASTPMHEHPQRWYWTNPILSYLWSENEVSTIVLNEPHNYEPYHPFVEAIIPKYKHETLFEPIVIETTERVNMGSYANGQTMQEVLLHPNSTDTLAWISYHENGMTKSYVNRKEPSMVLSFDTLGKSLSPIEK